MEELVLAGNALTGEIPRELGSLSNLEWLSLNYNGLTGEIPPELGGLCNLRHLYLHRNGLTGEIPGELGGLSNLTRFQWKDDAGFWWEDNAGLCAPGTREFIDFVQGLEAGNGPFCHEADAAVLRSFYHATGGSEWASSSGWLQTGPLADWHGIATDSLSGRVVGIDLTGNGLSGVLAGSLASLRALRELRLDGNGRLGGRLALGMTALPLRVLSYVDTSVCAPTDPEFRTWLASISSHSGTGIECPPLTDRDILEMLFHATNGPDWKESANWLTDAPLDAWHGVWTDGSGRVVRLYLVDNSLTGEIPPELGGLTNLVTLSLADNGLTGEIPGELGGLSNLKHEFGHNMHLGHAPCGDAGGPDPGYPHAGGRSGAWGWDHRSRSLVHPYADDVMGYCDEGAISDYHFANALRWRLQDETGIGAESSSRALLLWGGAGADGRPFLNPAFVVEAPPTPLDGTGAWQVAGEAEDGRVLFTRRFEMAEIADGDGRQSFVLALPAEPGWADSLSRIVLTGPDGSVSMDAQSGPGAALLRDAATGRVRGILRDWPGSGAAAQPDGGRALPEPGLEVQVSRGVPEPAAWRK